VSRSSVAIPHGSLVDAAAWGPLEGWVCARGAQVLAQYVRGVPIMCWQLRAWSCDKRAEMHAWGCLRPTPTCHSLWSGAALLWKEWAYFDAVRVRVGCL
jgi:hypothetical protein